MFTETDKKVLQVGLIGAGILIVVLGYYLWAVVKYDIQALDKEIDDNEGLVRAKTKELRELKNWKAKEAQIAAAIVSLQKEVQRLPTEPEARKFFGILQNSIRMTNLTENQISRLRNVPMGAYEEIPYQIVCRARFHELGQFLALVEQHKEQIMRIKTLSITNDLSRPSRHPVTLSVATFLFTREAPILIAKGVAPK